MTTDPFAPVAGNGSSAKPATTWVSVTPVPDDALAPPKEHPTRGIPSAVWEYHDASGALLHLVCRFDGSGNDKVVLPLSCARPGDGGPPAWRWRALDGQRPIFNLDQLAKRPDAPVIVVEGEKAAEAAAELLADHVTTTSSGGSKAAAKADWSPLRARSVCIWSDADEAGQAYAEKVSQLVHSAGAAKVAIINPPNGVASGWDAADALAEGWDAPRALALVGTARSTDAKRAKGKGGKRRKRKPQRDRLLELIDSCELWHDASGEAFVTIPVKGHRENWPVRSTRFRRWLALRFSETTGTTLGGQAEQDALRVIEGLAVEKGPEYATWRRVGRLDDRVFLDLCDPAWRALEITADGWRVVDTPPVKLMRSPAMRELPEPEAGGMIEELRGFVNVETDDDFKLLVAWLIAALWSGSEFPILVVTGEQGSGKSIISRLLRSLVDPNEAPIRAVPRDERDLIVSAVNAWVLCFDNLSSVAPWLADGLCRIATGSGYATRRLHTDRDEEVFSAARPIILNGIPNLTDRPDLADRAVAIHLPTISEDRRQPEDEFRESFEEARPRILAALLDGVSCALRRLPGTRLARAPRMAQFARLITAAEPGLGWDDGAFLQAYESNRQNIFATAFEADPLAVAVGEFVREEYPRGWEGKASQLLGLLNGRAPDRTRNAKSWPGSASALGAKLRR